MFKKSPFSPNLVSLISIIIKFQNWTFILNCWADEQERGQIPYRKMPAFVGFECSLWLVEKSWAASQSVRARQFKSRFKFALFIEYNRSCGLIVDPIRMSISTSTWKPLYPDWAECLLCWMHIDLKYAFIRTNWYMVD